MIAIYDSIAVVYLMKLVVWIFDFIHSSTRFSFVFQGSIMFIYVFFM